MLISSTDLDQEGRLSAGNKAVQHLSPQIPVCAERVDKHKEPSTKVMSPYGAIVLRGSPQFDRDLWIRTRNHKPYESIDTSLGDMNASVYATPLGPAASERP